MSNYGEPWKVTDNNTDVTENQPLFPGVTCVKTNELIADVFGDSDQVKAYSKRIVACVNACEGFENPADLRKQRDVLFNSLTRILPYAEDYRDCGPGDEGWQSEEVVENLQSARESLARCKPSVEGTTNE